MLRRLGMVAFLCIAAWGCNNTSASDQYARFHDDGRAKPIVALTPVFDRSGAEIGWSLSEEFTEDIRYRVLKRNNFYLTTPDEMHLLVTNLSEKQNPFSTTTDWIKDAFKDHEFVIFTELVEHDIHAKPLKGNFMDKITPSSELTLTMRVRIFDLRGSKPEVILQELVHQSYLIPKPSNLSESNPLRWKKMSFNISPLGLAHSQFAKEVSGRIEEYILLSKTK
ncbi:MAG: hypothetical protein K1060chlam2_00102 [Chlamydiae bacterium]|nr:hypothetical protein [Chlamydiota bacterium]